MRCDLRGQVAIVTGAGRGIGREIALALARSGAGLVLVSRDGMQLQQVVELIAEEGGSAIPCAADVTDAEAVRAFVDTTVTQFGRIDILVNNAAVNYVSSLALSVDKCWRRVMDVNVFGVYLCTKAVLPHMIRARSGRIINIASVAGKVGAPFNSAYSASKAAVIGFTKAVALEVASVGVTVNSICPWHVDTELMRESMGIRGAMLGRNAEQQLEDVIARNPQRRLITPGEVAGLTLFLTSPEARGITGQALNQCGGAVTGC